MDLDDSKWSRYSQELKVSSYNTALKIFYYRVAKGYTYIGCDDEVKGIFEIIIEMYSEIKSRGIHGARKHEWIQDITRQIMDWHRDRDPREEGIEKILLRFLKKPTLKVPKSPDIPHDRFILTKPRDNFAKGYFAKTRACAVILLMLEDADEGIPRDDIKKFLNDMGYNDIDFVNAFNHLLNRDMIRGGKTGDDTVELP